MKLKTLLTDNVIKLIKNRSLVRFIIEFKKQSKNSIVLYFIENADGFESFIKKRVRMAQDKTRLLSLEKII